MSVADGFWLAAYVALAVGLSSLIVGGHGVRRIDVDGLIDIGSFAVLAMLVVTQFGVVRDIVTDSSYSISTRAIWTAYPVLDAALLGVVAQAMFSRRLRGLSGVFLSCGAALWLTSDFISLVFGDSAAIHQWLDLGWMVGAVGLAVSTWPATGSRRRLPRTTFVVTRGDQRPHLHHPAATARARHHRDLCSSASGHDPNPVAAVRRDGRPGRARVRPLDAVW